MSRLCNDFHSALTAPVLASLFDKAIYTGLSFVRTNPKLLAKITGLQYNQILQIKDAILSKFSSTLKTGNKYYQEIINHCAILSSGIQSFDILLDGGFVTGTIYEVCGFSGCGKTQLCMTITANICSRNQQILYVDTKNDISCHRLFDILSHNKVLNVGEVLQKIQIINSNSSCDLLQQLHQVADSLKNSKELIGFKMIIIDSLSALFQCFHDQDEGLSVLNSIASLLKYICVEYHMVVLVTNYVSSWAAEVCGEIDYEDEDQGSLLHVQQPAMGRYWAHVPNIRIMMKKLDSSNECFLTILKSTNQPVGKSVKINLSDAGVT